MTSDSDVLSMHNVLLHYSEVRESLKKTKLQLRISQ